MRAMYRGAVLAGAVALLPGLGWAQEADAQAVVEPAAESVAAEPAVVESIPVAAAETPAPVPVAADSPNEPQQLEEVVVTARRKEERVQDVPISIAVMDGESLGKANLTLATDLQERVPGLVVSAPNPRLTSFTIRGLGSSSANDGIESSVGLFLDGVYLGRQGLSLFDLVDLDRVEILRGPQGTLFGKNTTAGAINIVTREPDDVFGATVEGTYGNLGTTQIRGTVTGPFDSDGVWSGRLTGYFSQRDGTIHNTYDDTELNARHRYGLRGQVLWKPADNFRARFIGEFGNTDETCCVYPLIAPVRKAVSSRDEFMEYQRASVDPYERKADFNSLTDLKMLQRALSAELTLDLNENNRLVSITAYRNWYFLPTNDDATSLNLAHTGTENKQLQVSQEIRLDSKFEHADSVAGLYYIRQDFHGREQVTLGDDMVGWVFGGLIRGIVPVANETTVGPALYAIIPPRTLDGVLLDTPYSQLSDSLSGFGSVNWHITEWFDVTTGLRYTQEWKKAHVARSRTGGDPNATAISLGDPLLAVLDQALGTSLYDLSWSGLLDGIAGGAFERRNERAEGNFSGQVALTFKLSHDLMTYASVARGYKGGGVNLGVTGDNVKPTFEPEEATALEAGMKGRFFGGSVAASLAVYHTIVDDYQALTFDDEQTLLPNPRQTNLLNVGKVRLQGVELEGYGYAWSGMMLRFGVAYSDAVTKDFKNAPNEDRALAIGGISLGTQPLFVDLSGETLYNAPEWSGTAGAEQTIFFGSGTEAFGGLDYSWRTDYWATVEHGKASYIEGYGIANARLGLRSENRLWEATLWCRNFLNEEYLASVYALYGVGDYGGFAGDERTYGVTLRANFN